MAEEIERDQHSGQNTTGHEWDGIKELNTPLPLWWLWTFYATVLWAIGYWAVYPAWPLIADYTGGLFGYSSRAEHVESLAATLESRRPLDARVEAAGLEDIRTDPELLEFALASGRSSFALHCSQCHGSGAEGSPGFPNLNDDVWIWGGTLDAIEATIRHGVRSDHDETRNNVMPNFLADEILSREEVEQVADFVLSLSDSRHAASEEGATLFADNCAICHGDGGEGIHDLGAPALNDALWFYGGDRDTVIAQISKPKHGVMPAWDGRLDSATIKKLAVFVHSLGGGEF